MHVLQVSNFGCKCLSFFGKGMSPDAALVWVHCLAVLCRHFDMFIFSILNLGVNTINIAHCLQVILYCAYAYFLYTDRKYSIWLCGICIFSGEDLTGGEIAGIAVGMSDLLPPWKQRAPKLVNVCFVCLFFKYDN